MKSSSTFLFRLLLNPMPNSLTRVQGLSADVNARQITHSLEIRNHIAVIVGLTDLRYSQELDKLRLGHKLRESISDIVKFRLHRRKCHSP
jgi:hypothetical protein